MRSSFSPVGLVAALACTAVFAGCDGKKTAATTPSSPTQPSGPVVATPTPPSATASSAQPAASAPVTAPSASAPAGASTAEIVLDIQVPPTVGTRKRALLILLHGLANTGTGVITIGPDRNAQKPIVVSQIRAKSAKYAAVVGPGAEKLLGGAAPAIPQKTATPAETATAAPTESAAPAGSASAAPATSAAAPASASAGAPAAGSAAPKK